MARYVRNDRTEARGNWSGEVNGIRPIGNFLYPRQRRRDLRPRLHDDQLDAAQRARRLVAVPGAQRPPARGRLRSCLARASRRPPWAVQRRQLPAALRFRLALRHRREHRRHDDAQHLLVPADVDAHLRQPHAARRLRRAALSRVRHRAGPRRGPVRFPRRTTRAQRDNSARALRPGRRQLPARPAAPAARSIATPSA